MHALTEPPRPTRQEKHDIEAVIDRLAVTAPAGRLPDGLDRDGAATARVTGACRRRHR
ncbi:hypothetical protein [Actinoalloteichus hoggarensis]